MLSAELLGDIIKFGPVACGLLSFVVFVIINHVKGRKNNLGDLFTFGLAGSSLPTGVLGSYGAFDSTVIPIVSDSGVYIAFAGAALLIIACQTFKEKA